MEYGSDGVYSELGLGKSKAFFGKFIINYQQSEVFY